MQLVTRMTHYRGTTGTLRNTMWAANGQNKFTEEA